MRIRETATCVAAAVALSAIAQTPGFRFTDIANESGLRFPNTSGGKDKKNLIPESTGTGAAIFDFDGDGANDLFIANGTILQSDAPPAGSCIGTMARVILRRSVRRRG